jgi:subtilisin family serine protease
MVMIKKTRLVLFLIFFLTFLPQLHLGSVPDSTRKIVVFHQDFIDEQAQDFLLKKSGAVKIKPLKLINGAVVVLSGPSEKVLKKDKNVVRIDKDSIVEILEKKSGKKPKEVPPQPDQEFPWNMFMIGADLAWAETQGASIKVAILDTGIDLDHPDLVENIVGDVNVLFPHKDGDDDSGHGTHVAGVIAGVDNAIGIIGVGPKASLYSVKVLDKKGRGWVSDVIEGMEWCIQNQMQVMNMSFGTLTDNASLGEAVQNVHKAGIVQVAAAGNRGEGDGAISFPARYPQTIAVSAVDRFGNFAPFSSYGDEIDLTAPGVDIQSTIEDGYYAQKSGTSMSAPHVTGTVALMLTLEPAKKDDKNRNGVWDPDEIKLKLEQTSISLGLAEYQQGAGLIRSEAAIR